MKYSELKTQNAALRSMHVERLKEQPGQPKKLRVIHMIDEQLQAQLGAKQYADEAIQKSAQEIVRFLVCEHAVKVCVVDDPKTKDRALVFELKVIP